MSTTGKTGGGLLSTLANPVTRKPTAQPIVVPPEAEEAFGLTHAADSPLPPTSSVTTRAEVAAQSEKPAAAWQPAAAEPEKSKTFFLPYSLCERLEMQKISERREMKHIVRQALEEYFERNPLRPAVRDLYRE